MKYSLLIVLAFAVCGLAQEGPWEIWMTGNALTSPEVCVRGSNADILFIENDSVRYARFSLATHQLVVPPMSVFALQGWNTQGLHDLIAVNDSTWACLLNEDERPMLPGDDNDLYDRTTLLFGNEDNVNSTLLAQGLWHEYWIQSGDRYDDGFSLVPRIGGGAIGAWVRTSFAYADPDISFHAVIFDPELVVDFECDGTVGLWGNVEGNRAVSVSLLPDSFAVSTGQFDGGARFCIANGPGWYETCYGTDDCEFEIVDNFAALHDGIYRLLKSSSTAIAVVSILTSDGSILCEELSALDLPLPLTASYWHPDFGFAALHSSPSSLQLARIDTNGTQFLPTGTVFWRDSLHIFEEGNVTITDAGDVIVLWTERQEFDTAGYRLMLGSVGWDTPLASGDAPFIPHPSSFTLSAYPNPFNGETTIAYALPQRANVELGIYNILGERVAVLAEGMAEAGAYALRWQPQVSSGIYVARLAAGPSTVMQKIVYLR